MKCILIYGGSFRNQGQVKANQFEVELFQVFSDLPSEKAVTPRP